MHQQEGYRRVGNMDGRGTGQLQESRTDPGDRETKGGGKRINMDMLLCSRGGRHRVFCISAICDHELGLSK